MCAEYTDHVAAVCIGIIQAVYAEHPGIDGEKARIFAIYDLVASCNAIARRDAPPPPYSAETHSLCAAQWILEVGLVILSHIDMNVICDSASTPSQKVLYARECAKNGGIEPILAQCTSACAEAVAGDPFVADVEN